MNASDRLRVIQGVTRFRQAAGFTSYRASEDQHALASTTPALPHYEPPPSPRSFSTFSLSASSAAAARSKPF
jgi:hypothetical protein